MKNWQTRSELDRRESDVGPPGKLPERRRMPDRRLPEVAEVPFAAFASAYTAMRKKASTCFLKSSSG
ncbi:MAG: hypothetical protein H6942_07845 [Candidatus Accumulibacter sp.]|uniref:hypothetical protein n=1 Tax=Accumulibacter sp. TaxID=2053492 RepID=UPI001A100AD5|nr:hypothetical protein [Accumulibacter sp.]MBE2258321.1 hypothetical protein [Paracoccaceae bacterium]MCP5248440.1 hypothetical protein [Accumulibacter sp.]